MLTVLQLVSQTNRSDDFDFLITIQDETEDEDDDDDFPIDFLLQLLGSSLLRPQSQAFPFFGRQFGPCQRSNQFPPTRPQCSPCGPRAFCPRFNAQAPSAFSIPIRFANQENTTKSPEPKTTTTNPNNNNNNSEVVHYGIICDGCGARPIRGLRFKCTTCPDFDLCEKCTTQNLHKEHQFTKITEPSRIGLPFFLRRFNELAQNSQKSTTTNTTTNTNDSEKLPTETSKQIPESKQEDSEKIPEEKKTEENSEKKEQEELTPFEQKLKQLQDMGFYNRDENIRLLVNNRGDIVRTVAQLLN